MRTKLTSRSAILFGLPVLLLAHTANAGMPESVDLSGSLTQFYQGSISGDGPHAAHYGGKVDAFANLDGAKLGLWNGFFVNSHAELNYGHARPFAGGTFLPNNAALALPGTNETRADLSLYLVQALNPKFLLMFGKFNMLDLYASSHTLTGGRGVQGFQHIELVGPVSGIVPAVMFGGIAVADTGLAKYTVMIYDPADRTGQTGFSHAFEKGVSFNGSVELATGFGNRPGRQWITLAYSTQNGIDLNDIPALLIPGAAPGSRSNRWYAAYSFEQTLWTDPANARNTWGLFGQWSISDGNPNPLEYSGIAGIAGTSPIATRSADRFGIGVFYVRYSDDLRTSLQPLLSVHDEYGIEAFYRYAPAPWLELTADLQVLQPPLSNKETAIVAGIRVRIAF